MTLHNKTKKGVHGKFTALVIAALLALAATLFIVAPKLAGTTKANAASIDDISFASKTNISGVTVDVLLDYMDYTEGSNATIRFRVIADTSNLGHEFLRYEFSAPFGYLAIEDSNVYLYFPYDDRIEYLTPAMAYYAFTVIFKNVIPLPEPPIKDGYTFTGWFLDEACTNPYADQEITEETTFYAGWVINRYTVTFTSDSGVTLNVETVDWRDSVTVTPLTREGYDFLGWFNGDTKYTNAPIKENTTLTAKWQIKVYTVTFMVDGVVYKTLEVEHGLSFEKAMQAAGMSYFNLMTDGVKDGKSGIITTDITAEAAAMTAKEKTAAFIANNIWILWTLGAGFALFLITMIILIVKKIRG